jgi:hypothetical protein
LIADAELLAAVRAAGEPGTESHRLACRLYRRSVLEWKAGTVRARREREARTVLSRSIALLAAAAAGAGWLDYTGCGTHDGYNKHAYEKTPACPACLEAERGYSRDRKRAKAQGKQALREAA